MHEEYYRAAAGLWPRKNDCQGFGAFYRKWLPRGIFFMINYAMTIGFPGITYESVVVGDVQASLESVATFFAALLMYCHLYCLLFEKDKLRAVFEEMDVVREMGKRLPYQPVDIFILNMRLMEFVVFVMVVCELIIVGVGIVLIPELYFTREFVFNEWFPFDTRKSPVYEVLFSINCMRMVYLLTMIVQMYMIIWAMFVEVFAQYSLLSHNIDQVRYGSQKSRTESPNGLAAGCAHIGSEIVKLSVVVDEEIRQAQGDEPQKPRKKLKKKKLNEALKKCVQHHQSIIKFVHLVESTFETILFMHIVCTLVPTGLGINLVLNAESMEVKIVMIVFLIIGCYLLLGVISFFADKITEQDEGIRDAIYGCDWLGAPDSFTRSIRIIMSVCNRPLVIKLAAFVPLNRASFHATMKLTYSYTMTMLTQFK